MFRFLALALAIGCSSGPGTPADAGIDADVARTDLVPAVGTDMTLDVATWNLKMFPTAAETARLAGDLVASLAVDVIAVQEIESRAALDAMIARLPGWELAMPTEPGSASGGIALAWRTAAVQATSVELVHDDDTTFVRPVVRAELETGDDRIVLFIVHLKAGTAPSDEATRIAQMTALEATVRAWVETGDADRVLVLGDFNADFDDARGPEVFAPWTGAPEQYTVLTQPLDEAGLATFLPANITLDHAIATRALDVAITGTPIVPPLATQLPDYARTVSDHLPVIVRLQP